MPKSKSYAKSYKSRAKIAPYEKARYESNKKVVCKTIGFALLKEKISDSYDDIYDCVTDIASIVRKYGYIVPAYLAAKKFGEKTVTAAALTAFVKGAIGIEKIVNKS